MRIPICATPRLVRSLRLAAFVAATAVLGGCATLRATLHGYELGPNGITRPQQQLRQALVHGDFATALSWREDDALMRALTTGISSYYAAQYARSAAVLDSAALLADDRITASVSRDALALVSNDMARPYQPRRTERLFIPYYGMLAYAQLGEWEEAAVEARRLEALLGQYADDADVSERPVHAALHYLAGTVLERAAQPADAEVAYRLARQLSGSVFAAAAATGRGQGEVVVVLERGFVAHRATESVNVFMGDDRDSLRHGDSDRGRAVARIASRVAGIGGSAAMPPGRGGPSVAMTIPGTAEGREEHRRHHGRDDDEDSYWLSVAFPALRRSARPWGADVRVQLDADTASSAALHAVALVDDAAGADERRERGALLARAVGRAATKYAVTKVVRDKKGEVAGTIANVGASLMERADVRSWHLLPQELVVLRVRAAAGTHALALEVGEGVDRRVVSLGPVTVRPGLVSVATLRLWQDPPSAALLATRGAGDFASAAPR